jgi:cold shock CspA family protein
LSAANIGFIKPDLGGPDVFVQMKNLIGTNALFVGDVGTFDDGFTRGRVYARIALGVSDVNTLAQGRAVGFPFSPLRSADFCCSGDTRRLSSQKSFSNPA